MYENWIVPHSLRVEIPEVNNPKVYVRGRAVTEDIALRLIAKEDMLFHAWRTLESGNLGFIVPGPLGNIYTGQTWLHENGSIWANELSSLEETVTLGSLKVLYDSLLDCDALDMVISYSRGSITDIYLTIAIIDGYARVSSGPFAQRKFNTYAERYPFSSDKLSLEFINKAYVYADSVPEDIIERAKKMGLI